MEGARAPLSPGGSKRRRASSSNETLPMIPPGLQQSQQQTTSLPSIRQLHPYLPPSSSTGITHSTNEAVSYPYSGSSYPPHAANAESVPSHSMGATQRDNPYGVGESEAEDPEHPSPPKKKRRRQALSCTECKRRKIKCDRTHPCTPCTRRGEEAGCQWHIVEPVDKYVTKAEFDDLKLRYEQLESYVRRHLPVATTGSGPMPSYYPLGVPSGMPLGMSEPVSMSYGGASPTNMGYSGSMMAPAHNHPYHHTAESSTQPVQPTGARYTKTEGAPSLSPTRPTHINPMGMAAPNASPSMSAMIQNPPTSSRHRTSSSSKASPSLPTAAIKASPLSLSSITSPFQPEPSSQGQQKNFHAQTLILGERLRLGPEDPLTILTHRTSVAQAAISVHLRTLKYTRNTHPPQRRRLYRLHRTPFHLASIRYNHALKTRPAVRWVGLEPQDGMNEIGA